MNRQERRGKGRAMLKRAQTLRNSQILKDADLSDLPEDVIKSLQGGHHDNVALQKRYDTAVRIMSELIQLEMELKKMDDDIILKRELHSRKDNL